MRVAVIFDHFGPYHCARVGAASRRFSTAAIEVAGESTEYPWSRVRDATGASRVTLFASHDSRAKLGKGICERVEVALQNCRPDAVAIPGWSDNAAIAALNWCTRARVPAILMSESTALDKPRIGWREWIKRRLVDLYSTALVGGRRHVDYLVQLGMPRERIFTGYDVVDNSYFAERAKKVRNQKEELRSRYGLPENYFLAVARFIEKKNLPMLIRTYAAYRQLAGNRELQRQTTSNRPWDLVLLGDGPLRETLNSQLSTLNLHAYVHLPGFKQYDELPVYYALAKAFVHSSTTEQWGLVVNEAVASGLPVIISNRCGCVPELVGDNGFAFDPMNEHELAGRLLEMASLSDADREHFGEVSCRIAARFGPERFAEGLEQAAVMGIKLAGKKIRPIDVALLFTAKRF